MWKHLLAQEKNRRYGKNVEDENNGQSAAKLPILVWQRREKVQRVDGDGLSMKV
jgi:hypothetical protein